MTKGPSLELASTPFRPAHAAVEPRGLTRLTDTKSVLARYRLPGPHATVVLPIATPGRAGDDIEKRWHATRADLVHLGADEAILQQLDTVVGGLPPSGHQALVTANSDSAAYCWLLTAAGAMMHVGQVPSLVPALIEVDRRPRVVVAAVDRVGADIAIVDHAHLETNQSADGERDGIHKSSGLGPDQARAQRHSEVVWERNATAVAGELSRLVRTRRAPVVVLSGDRRAVDLVADRVASPNVAVYTAQAGGRHEPDTSQRLLAAGIAAASSVQEASLHRDRGRLTEELGQHDLAVDGEVHTLQAIADHRASMLFVDAETWSEHDHIGETIRAAQADGADICVVSVPGLPDGVGALLRRPYD